MPAQNQKRGVKQVLDSLIDEDGLRTEVTVTLTNKTLLRVALYLVGTSIVSTVAIYTVKNIMKGETT